MRDYDRREAEARAAMVQRFNWALFWSINALTTVQWVCYLTGYFGVIH